jgi:hypothetical protein
MKRCTMQCMSALGLVSIAAFACNAQVDELPPLDFDGISVPAASGPPPVPGTSPDAGSANPPSPDTCPYSGKPIDVSGMKPCMDGGRCVPGAAIPVNERGRLAECPGGYCVAEKIIVNKGNYVPKACKSLVEGEGRCTSLVFPDLAKQKDSLPRDVCDANERCAPCFDPVTGKETGACRSVSCDAPTTTAKVFPSCCSKNGVSRGRCVDKVTMPPEAAKGLAQRECADTAMCVPDEFLANTPAASCRASALTGILFGAYDGVCLSDCIPRDFLGQIGTARGSCQDGFFCAPCKNPLDGKPTGAPGCAP